MRSLSATNPGSVSSAPFRLETLKMEAGSSEIATHISKLLKPIRCVSNYTYSSPKMHEVDEKTLTQPPASVLHLVRELASNWDVDIACELEDYLSKLSRIDLSANGVQINFAEGMK